MFEKKVDYDKKKKNAQKNEIMKKHKNKNQKAKLNSIISK